MEKFCFFAAMGRNAYFRFKQFTVYQDISDALGLKVCTDACVLGAWSTAETGSGEPLRLLDIGTGTGLLALMLAQRFPEALIDAIELDPPAAEQAAANFDASPFRDRLRVIRGDVRGYAAATGPGYDAIVTNPPFFQQDLRSPKPGNNLARHAVTLTLGELALAVNHLLKPGGTWNVLLPIPESTQLAEIAAKYSWQVTRHMQLVHHPDKNPFRALMTFRRQVLPGPAAIPAPETLSIYHPDRKSYSDGFATLLRDFYLAF